MKLVLLFLSIFWQFLLYSQVGDFHNLEETLSRIESMISHREKGAYLCFDKADIQMALGEDQNFWNQFLMQEVLALNEPNVLKSRSLPYNALNGHRPEDLWAVDVFNRAKDSWNDCYAPLAPAFLSTTHQGKCIRFFQFLQGQPIVLVGEVPSATSAMLFAPNCKSIATTDLDEIESECLQQFSDSFRVVVLALDSTGKFLAKRLLDQLDSVFIIDLGCMREALCGWSPDAWTGWIDTASRIKILFTSALIPNKFEERKREYIKSLKIIDGYGFKGQVYIVEAGGFTPLSFFEGFCEHVFYANTNDTSYINKGVNEAKASLAAFNYYGFDDEDMIVKLTGRYLFNNDGFLQLVKLRPDIDAFASYFADRKRGVTTGCFAMRCKYYKRMLKELDFKKMEEKLIDIEWEVAQFLQKMASENAKVMYVEKIGITANVANAGVEQW